MYNRKNINTELTNETNKRKTHPSRERTTKLTNKKQPEPENLHLGGRGDHLANKLQLVREHDSATRRLGKCHEFLIQTQLLESGKNVG